MKKQKTVKTEDALTAAKADKMWNIIKEISALRIKEIGKDRAKTEKMYALAEKTKDEFLESIAISLYEGDDVVADDILMVLTTMTMLLASEMFADNELITTFLNVPEPEVGTGNATDCRAGAPLYV